MSWLNEEISTHFIYPILRALVIDGQLICQAMITIITFVFETADSQRYIYSQANAGKTQDWFGAQFYISRKNCIS